MVLSPCQEPWNNEKGLREKDQEHTLLIDADSEDKKKKII